MTAPLDGVRVLDLGQIYQGGYAGLLLSYLGADVIKVEPPWGENVRTRSEDGMPPQFQLLNATKRGITLDLTRPAGKEALCDLVEKADVLLENFAVGKMDDLGLGYDDLRAVNPGLVYAHGSGFGDDGPYADRPAMDLTVQAMSGVMSTTGFPDGDPVKAGPAVCDFMGGVHLVVGVLGALYRRRETGEGDYVDVGMYDTMYPTLASPVSSWVNGSDAPERTGNRHSGHSIAPYNVYPVSDGHVAVICIAERHWESLAREMGREELLDDERYGSKAERAEHMETIDRIVGGWLAGREKADAVERLLAADVPAAPVRTVEEVVADDHLEARGMVNWLPDRSGGDTPVPVPGMPVNFERGDAPAVTPAPELGEHTAEVLREVAGYDEAAVAELRERRE